MILRVIMTPLIKNLKKKELKKLIKNNKNNYLELKINYIKLK